MKCWLCWFDVSRRVTVGASVSAASVSVPDASPPSHDRRERAGEGEQAAPEAREEDGKVKRWQLRHFVLYHFLLWFWVFKVNLCITWNMADPCNFIFTSEAMKTFDFWLITCYPPLSWTVWNAAGLQSNLKTNPLLTEMVFFCVPIFSEGSKQRRSRFGWRRRGGWRGFGSSRRPGRCWRSESFWFWSDWSLRRRRELRSCRGGKERRTAK